MSNADNHYCGLSTGSANAWPVPPKSLGCILTTSLAVLLIGCAKNPERFIPAPDVAEHAVSVGLDAWKAGRPPGPVDGTSPLIHVTDSGRKPGQELVNYKVLGEVASTHGRTFMAELELSKPVEKVKAEYIVVGIDPLWVFRRADYELLMHWDHHMPVVTSPDEVGGGRSQR